MTAKATTIRFSKQADFQIEQAARQSKKTRAEVVRVAVEKYFSEQQTSDDIARLRAENAHSFKLIFVALQEIMDDRATERAKQDFLADELVRANTELAFQRFILREIGVAAGAKMPEIDQRWASAKAASLAKIADAVHRLNDIRAEEKKSVEPVPRGQ